ncbi:MAG: spoIIIAD [Bacilli bacterium]|nr:spoIIIAD [Bacilli bacterium]
MEILQIVGLGLIGATLTLVVKPKSPQIAFLLSVLVGIFIFLFLLDKISAVFAILQQLAEQAHVNPVFLSTILKIIGIAYIAEFGASIVRDAGEDSIAQKVELAGKVLILVLAVPIIQAILQTILQVLP